MPNSNRARFLLVCAFLFIVSAAVIADPGVLYRCPKGRFQVVFPVKSGVVEDNLREQTPSGLIEGVQCHWHDDRTNYWIIAYEVPAGFVDPDTSAALGRVVDSVAKGAGARISSRSPFQFRGHPGLSASYESQGLTGRVGQVNAILVDRRFYTLHVWARTRGALLIPGTRTFFSSFDVL